MLQIQSTKEKNKSSEALPSQYFSFTTEIIGIFSFLANNNPVSREDTKETEKK